MSKLLFCEEYFKKETREGFVVGEMMKRCWAAQLEVLNDINCLCERHGIRWFADWGTLLGAVRHNGFIPWDDDVDIAMLKDDYIRFMYYSKLELSDKYRLLNVYTNGNWGMTFCRIVNGNGLTIERNYLNEWHGCPLLVGLDVFPYYYIPNNKNEEKKQLDILETIAAIKNVNGYAQKKKNAGKIAEYEEMNQILAESLLILEKRTGFILEPGKTLDEQMDIVSEQVMRFYDKEESDYVTQYCYYMGDRSMRMKKEWFDETVLFPFENISIPVPKGYDEVLTVLYGDWRTPVKNKAGHDYPYFSKQIRELKNNIEKSELIVQRRKLNDKDLSVPKRQDLKDSKNDKCVILMYTGIREMMIYSEHVIDKIRTIIDYCSKNRESVRLYWMPAHFDCNTNLPFDMVLPEFINDYNMLIEEYKKMDIGICDESGDIVKAIDSCDCFYGDESFLSDMFKMTGKPVLIQDYRIKEELI